ncbi:MAG: 4Fe-4S dicluster domain-containing protein [Thermoflexia bacterium]|nr:MAG: 4Fe-4S dicluster domain-containing protein [Thermoflexia bacterium]
MGTPRGLVFNLQRFSLHDGPGIRTTVFLKGCPLRCWWCHNPEGQSPEPDLLLRPERCIGCGACLSVCPNGAMAVDRAGNLRTNRSRCHHCGACVEVCYAGARELVGRWMTVEKVIAEVEWRTSAGPWRTWTT